MDRRLETKKDYNKGGAKATGEGERNFRDMAIELGGECEYKLEYEETKNKIPVHGNSRIDCILIPSAIT